MVFFAVIILQEITAVVKQREEKAGRKGPPVFAERMIERRMSGFTGGVQPDLPADA
jgi:hypothetical protein